MALILDTGPLYAALDRRDADYPRCREMIEETDELLVIPAPVLVEVDYWIHLRLYTSVMVALLDEIARGAFTVEELRPAWLMNHALVNLALDLRTEEKGQALPLLTAGFPSRRQIIVLMAYNSPANDVRVRGDRDVASITVGFSLPAEEKGRLDHLVETFAQGNRSAFLRLAMKQMEVVERAERLRDVQAYGVQQRTAEGLDDTAVESIVHRVLAKQQKA